MNHFIFYVLTSSTEQLGLKCTATTWSRLVFNPLINYNPNSYDTGMFPVPLFLFLSNFCIFVIYFCRDA